MKAQGNGQRIQGDFPRPLTLRQQQPCSVRIIAPVLWMRTLRFQRPSNWLRVTQQGREMVACEQGEGQSQGMRSTGHRKGLGKARGEAEAGREISGWPEAWPTHNAVWRWRTPDETLHFAAVAPDGVLHGLAGDDGGPCKQEDRVRASWNLQQPAPRPPTCLPQAPHRSRKVAPHAQPLRSEAQWPGRCRCRHRPGSPTSAAAGCCYSGPGQREQPRVGSQEAWAPRSVWAPALEALERKQEGPQVNSQKGSRVLNLIWSIP